MSALYINVEKDTVDMLENIAKRSDRTRDDVINEAIKEYIKHYELYIKEVSAGLEDVRNGRTVPFEKVKQSLRNIGYNID